MSRPVVRLGQEASGCSLLGHTVTARYNDKNISSFLGVPFAEPPTGERRFRSPKPVSLWSGTREANQCGSICPQDLVRAARTYGLHPNLPKTYNEDCLYLNVWTPNIRPHVKLPVMVWLHGGAFVQGFSNIFDGTALAAYEDVVVVSINYRVGVFGFLQTGDGPLDYHGNQGLLDQLEAFRWIQKYIGCFGGDPNNVTLFGESAGGMSASFHLVSPLAVGLFHKVIIQSGPGIVSNAVWPASGGKKYWWKRLHAMGFKGTESQAVVDYLRDKSSDEMLAAFSDWFVPTVADGTYLKSEPLSSFQAGNFQGVACIIGFNSSEGVGFVPAELRDSAAAKDAMYNLVAKNFFRGSPKAVVDKVAALTQGEYLHGDNFVSDVSDFYGDVNFVAPSIKQAEVHSEKASAYVYQFDHRPFFSPRPDWVMGDHGNEIPYVFGFPFLKDLPDIWPEEDRLLSRRLMSYWANFARTGNPNGVESEETIWHQYRPDSSRYLHIQTSSMTSCHTDQLCPTRLKLWNQTVPQIQLDHSPNKAKY